MFNCYARHSAVGVLEGNWPLLLGGLHRQVQLGSWIDGSHHKRAITAAGAAVVVAAAMAIAVISGICMADCVHQTVGLAITIFPPATAAFALGMAGDADLSKRVARKKSFTHRGNVAFAVTPGVLGTLLALQGIFFAAATGMAPEGSPNWQ